MAGLMVARMLQNDCKPDVTWAGQSGATTFYAKNFNVLVAEGHSKSALRKFERHRTKWLQASIAWMEDAGIKLAGLSREQVRDAGCDWASSISGTNHPAGRFLKSK
ncbi:hypothetical protein GCM10007385_27410 [Tateyamaria omphalii]|nr:hypothetical protein GCM10007385_27410 [Tateyamaria omphalii]